MGWLYLRYCSTKVSDRLQKDQLKFVHTPMTIITNVPLIAFDI